jgi:hypothetical protein
MIPLSENTFGIPYKGKPSWTFGSPVKHEKLMPALALGSEL